MIEQLLSGLYRIEIPLPQNPLKWLNAYVVKGQERTLIIDTGFNREECRQAMEEGLHQLGVSLDRTDFFITHIHTDHMGLLGSILGEGSRVYFNEREANWLAARKESQQSHWEKTLAVFTANGFADEAARTSMMSHPARKYSAQRRFTFTTLTDGDALEVGDFHFRCVSTPGHSPGHLCLYEETQKILVAGDHILFDITPNITYWSVMEDALSQYLASLDKVRNLDCRLVLPGHRRLVHDLQGRVKELEAHHQARLGEVIAALSEGEKNCLEIAPRIHWDITAKSWEAFPAAQKWFAFGETLAHVQYLVDQGRVQRLERNGAFTYALA